jgi:glucose-6-phosphate dehydrogenase assembly protein OpcA
MIDAATILDVMRKGGSLDEAAAACEMSLMELIDQAVELQEVATVVMRGATLCRAWWSTYLRQNISKTLCIDAYKELVGDMNNTLSYMQQQKSRISGSKIIK